jgi:hypothetical protein
MKSALPSGMALGVLLFGAAGSQAYGPSPGSSAAMLATELSVTGCIACIRIVSMDLCMQKRTYKVWH